MRVLVCGSRHFNDMDLLSKTLSSIDQGKNITTIIHGRAKGADYLAGIWAHNMNIVTEEYPANWEVFGKSAGPIRNKQMLDEGRPDLVIAFLTNVGEQEIFYGLSDSQYNRGTKNMIQQATKAGIPVKVISYDSY